MHNKFDRSHFGGLGGVSGSQRLSGHSITLWSVTLDGSVMAWGNFYESFHDPLREQELLSGTARG